jgi:hypothetical protein
MPRTAAKRLITADMQFTHAFHYSSPLDTVPPRQRHGVRQLLLRRLGMNPVHAYVCAAYLKVAINY